ncbi:ATP-grasp domain-containing protein [Rhodobacter maris]|nr:ATP-grasp domain-containing protein [Rhodobacter maris]
MRPVADGKEQAGKVRPASEILEIARKVMTLDPEEIPHGSLRPETRMMLTQPVRILTEWRIWVVAGEVVTFLLYKEGDRVTYRSEIDADALAFAQGLARLNPGYATAYVMDICRTESGLKLLETNCINAAGFYAADVMTLAAAIDALG